MTDRIFIESSPKVKEEVKELTKAGTSNSSTSLPLPLKSLQFFVHKSGSKSPDALKSQIKKLGGKTVTKFNTDITAVISSEG